MNDNSLQVFDKLPKGWVLTTLGEALPILYGKGLPEAKRDGSGDVPVYGSNGQVGQHSAALTKKAALIIGRKGSAGEVHYSSMPCWPIDTTYYAEEREGIEIRFFEYLLRGLNLGKLEKSTAVPGLSRDDYNAVEVAIAPLGEQKLIVAEIEKQFSRLDEAVTGLKRAKVNLKRYKAAVLKAAVEGKLTEQWRKEHPGVEPASKLLERILTERRNKWGETELARMRAKGKEPKDDRWEGKYQEPYEAEIAELRELPQGWLWVLFDSLMDHESPQNGLYKNIRHLTTSGGTPLLDIKGLYKGFSSSFGGMRRFKLEDIEKSLYMLEEGNILVNRVSKKPEGVGKSVLVENLPEQTVFESNMMRIRLLQNIVPKFINYFLNSEEGRAAILRKAKMTQQASVNQDDIKNLPIPFPPFREQSIIVGEIEERLSVLGGSEASIEVNLKRAERLRQSILKKAFAGELVTQKTNQKLDTLTFKGVTR
jgi:type I restriction enzyme S subunit